MRYLSVKPSDMLCAGIFSRVILLCTRLIRDAICLLEIRPGKFNVKASAPSSALISSPDFKPALMQDQRSERLRWLRQTCNLQEAEARAPRHRAALSDFNHGRALSSNNSRKGVLVRWNARFRARECCDV